MPWGSNSTGHLRRWADRSGSPSGINQPLVDLQSQTCADRMARMSAPHPQTEPETGDLRRSMKLQATGVQDKSQVARSRRPAANPTAAAWRVPKPRHGGGARSWRGGFLSPGGKDTLWPLFVFVPSNHKPLPIPSVLLDSMFRFVKKGVFSSGSLQQLGRGSALHQVPGLGSADRCGGTPQKRSMKQSAELGELSRSKKKLSGILNS